MKARSMNSPCAELYSIPLLSHTVLILDKKKGPKSETGTGMQFSGRVLA
jgi:hypothetical protein